MAAVVVVTAMAVLVMVMSYGMRIVRMGGNNRLIVFWSRRSLFLGPTPSWVLAPLITGYSPMSGQILDPCPN